MATVGFRSMSVEDAAHILGCTVSRVRQLLRAETIVGEKLNARAWAVDRRSVAQFARKQPKTGRPRVGKTA